MSLFKIFKGTSSDLGVNNSTTVAHDGYAYFTSDDGKFYIDVVSTNSGTAPAVIRSASKPTGNRIPLSADKADRADDFTISGHLNAQNTGFIDDLSANSLLVTGPSSFTGGVQFQTIPTSPTAAAGDSTTSIATTEFVNNTITSVINTLDVSNISGFGAGKTLASLTETDGKISATFQDIEIPWTKVTGKPSSYYTLPIATSSALGGIKIGYSESGSNYAVKLSNEQAYVTVPWTDTKVTQSALNSSNNTEYKLLTSVTSSPSGADTAGYSSNLAYNPSLNRLKTGNLELTGTLDVTQQVTFDDNLIAQGISATDLTVNGPARFNNGINTNNITIGNLNVVPTETITSYTLTLPAKTDTIATLSDLPQYSLPTASSATLGGIKTGYTANGKNYAVVVDQTGNAYVNVPWQNDNTTSFTIAANATDGYWDLTGTSGTNAVTYSLAPYSSKQATASFYTGTTDPTLTTRLNYDGYFYATKLYSGGQEVLTEHQSLNNYLLKADGVTNVSWNTTGKKITKTINGNTNDVVQFEAGSNITLTATAGKLTITSSFTNSRDPGYGKIKPGAASSATASITKNTTQIVSTTYTELLTINPGNKWIELAATNGTNGDDDSFTIAHAISGVTAGNYGDSTAQTPGYSGTFKVPYVSVDEAGHVTGISVHNVTIPASDNTDTKVNVKLATTSKAYLLGTITTPTNSVTAVTAVADTGIYLDTVAGQLGVGSINITGGAYNASGVIKANSNNNIFFSFPITENGTTVNVIPLNITDTYLRPGINSNGTIDLGSSTVTWNNIYGNHLYTQGASLTGDLNVTGYTDLEQTHIDSAEIDSLIVNGAAIAQTPAAGSSDNQIATTEFVSSAVAALPGPMRFVGSVGSVQTPILPSATSTNIGHTYKVSASGTYAGISAKLGDLFISDGADWVYIPSADDDVVLTGGQSVSNDNTIVGGVTVGGLNIAVNTKTITGSAGISVTGSTTQITIVHSNTISAMTTYTSNAQNGNVRYINNVLYDSQGHITSCSSVPIYNPGLYISAEDVNKGLLAYSGQQSLPFTNQIDFIGDTFIKTSATQSFGPGYNETYITISHPIQNNITSGTAYGAAATTAPGYEGTFKVPQISVDSRGHVTSISDYEITLPTAPTIAGLIGAATGSATLGIYWNGTNFTPMTHEVKATVNTGTVNQIAYYSNTSSISGATLAWDNWVNGSTSGPRAVIKIGSTSYTANPVPIATATQSGVISTTTQQFAGDKTFQGNIYPSGSSYNLGSSVTAWGNIYATTMFSSQLNTSGDLNVTGDAYLNNETYIDSAEINNLIIKGPATAQTPEAGSNDEQIATTEFVSNAIAAIPEATDRYVNSATFTYHTTNDNVLMTLTRAGSDTNTITANIPKVSTNNAGVVPKGVAVTAQSQTSQFLRSDGTWATPSYTKYNNFGICSTGAGTTTKAVNIPYFTHTNGDVFYVQFTKQNTVQSPTLNVNGLGAQPIYDSYGQRLSDGGSGANYTSLLNTDKIYEFMYDSDLNGGSGGYRILNNIQALELQAPRESTTSLNLPVDYGGLGNMFHILATSKISTTEPNAKTPFDANILQMNWDNKSGNYNAQLGIATGGTRMVFRSGTIDSRSWQEVAHAPAGSAVGSSTQPIYMNSNGQLIAAENFKPIYYNATSTLTSFIYVKIHKSSLFTKNDPTMLIGEIYTNSYNNSNPGHITFQITKSGNNNTEQPTFSSNGDSNISYYDPTNTIKSLSLVYQDFSQNSDEIYLKIERLLRLQKFYIYVKSQDSLENLAESISPTSPDNSYQEDQFIKYNELNGSGSKITLTGTSQAVITSTTGSLITKDLSGNYTSTTNISFIKSISQASDGKITATTATIPDASTSTKGIVQLSSATNSTATDLAATPSAIKTVYDLANSHKYWANIESTTTASYTAQPEVQSIKINGSTNASAATTKNVTLVYDASLEVLNFVFS